MLLTCAGESTRFEGWGPKWRLTHPSGNIMAAEAARPFADDWQTVVVLSREDVVIPSPSHREAVLKEFSFAGIHDARVVVLETKTANRMDTVLQALEILDLVNDGDQPVLVRDCDNLVEADITPGMTAVAVGDVFKYGPVNPKDLSFVDNRGGQLWDIAEEGLVTRWFCTGAYAVERASMLTKAGSWREPGWNGREVTTMADAMCDIGGARRVHDGGYITAVETTRYSDWGTGEKWKAFKREHRVIFLDIDGVLFTASHRSFGAAWKGSKPLYNNRRKIQALHQTGRIHLVLCTSRPETVRDWTITQLKRGHIPYDQLIMGLPACGRLLVNDAVTSRRERTAEAVEVVRDDDALKDALRKVGL